MDAGGDAGTPGPHHAPSTMSADDAWGLKQRELHAKAKNQEAILAELKRKFEDTQKKTGAP